MGFQVNHEDIEVQAMEDYHRSWRDRLANRDRFRPIPPDQRLLRRSGWR
jgi:hypothetical protein